MVRHAPSCLRGPASGSNPAWSKRRPDAIRHELVARVRAEIAAGTYDTPERFEAALAELFLSADFGSTPTTLAVRAGSVYSP